MGFNLYGIIISLAILAAAFWTAREFKKAGEDPDQMWNALPWVVTFGVIGARLYHVIHYWGYYGQDLVKILEVWHGGLGIYGALLGGITGLGLFIYISNRAEGGSGSSEDMSSDSEIRTVRGSHLVDRGWDLSRTPISGHEEGSSLRVPLQITGTFIGWLNLAAPGLALGQAIGRLGNIVNHEILPYAVYELGWDLFIFLFLVRSDIKSPISRIKNAAARGVLDPSTEFTPPLAWLGMTINKWLSGSRFTLYLFLYALGRFFLEFSRTDNVWRLGALSVAQIISLLIVVVIVTRRILESRTPRLQAPGALATGGQAQNDGIN